MTRRREFPAKVKIAAFKRAADHCEGCSAPLMPGRFDYDHVIPDWMGGEPTLENCAVLCKSCHGTKTGQQDAPTIAKAKSVQRKHIGAHKSRNPPPGGRGDKRKRKIDGTVVRRDEE